MRNVIKNIPVDRLLDIGKDSGFFALSKTGMLHFASLVSRTYENDNVIYAYAYANYVPAKVILELEECGAIEVDDNKYIVLGENGTLFINRVDPLKEMYTRIDTEFIQPLKARRRVNTMLLESADKVSFYLENSSNIKKPIDLMYLFNSLYTVINESPNRSFTGKEIGQIKHLIAYYGISTSAQLIVSYALSNSFISIGALLNSKDYLYNKLRKGKGAESKTASVSNGDNSKFV